MECSNLLKNCQIQTNLSSLLFKPMSLTSSCLASDGASKMLTDLLQFQIDGLHSPSSSDRIKRSCALKIFDVCSNYDNRTFLTQAGVMEVLLNTLKLLGREKDVTVRLSLVGLCWCFFSNPNVSCNQNYWIESIFPHLFASCVSSEELNANRNAKPVTDSLVHRKRKFTQKQSPQIQNTNTISDGCCSNEAIDSTDQRIIDLIQQRYSNLFRLIRGETQDIYPSVVAFERSLCLCLVSRILVTSVTCQSIYGNTTSLVSLSSKRFGASSSPRSPSNSQSSSSTSPGSTDLPDKTKDLLTVFQALLRRSTPSSSGATPQVFLSKLAISLQSQVSNIMTFLKSSNMLSLEAAENFISVQVRCDLFFLLTLLEASCFKCPENQV